MTARQLRGLLERGLHPGSDGHREPSGLLRVAGGDGPRASEGGVG
jgi:hypothetical protein